jgi:hypothetical protein
VVGGRSRGNCAPVVLTGLSGASVTGAVGVATGVGETVGVRITGGADTPALPVVGTVGAMTGATMLGGAMTGPDGAVTPCGPSPPWVPSTAPCTLSFSSSDSLLLGWVRGAMGRRPTFAGGYVLFLVRQKAGNPVCAILPGHVGLPGSQVFLPGCTSSAGRVDLQAGVRVDHRELPGNLAAPPVAGWQYQALVECPNLLEVGLVRQPSVMSPHARDHVLHRLQPVGPLSRRELLPSGHGVWTVGIRVHPLSTQMAEKAMALPLVEVGP